MLPDMKLKKNDCFLVPAILLFPIVVPVVPQAYPLPLGPLLELKRKSFWKILVNATSKLWGKKKGLRIQAIENFQNHFTLEFLFYVSPIYKKG
jgi:hypothetical protein